MDWVFYLLCGAALALAMLLLSLVLRARGLRGPSLRQLAASIAWLGGAARNALREIRSLVPIEAIRDLVTGQAERRYETPHIVVIGHRGSGKTQLASALAAAKPTGNVVQRPMKTASVGLPGWHDVDAPSGVVIDLPAPGESRGEWRRTLRKLDELRPERAVDGLVVTVSAELLLADDADAPDRRKRASQSLFEQLGQLRKHWELRLPVYLVVTKLDCLDGFKAFMDAVDGDAGQMWGWSSSESFDAQFSGRLIAEAFAGLSDSMRALQFARLGGAKHDLATGLLLFPRQFERLSAPLTHFADVAFAPNIHQSAFALRGVYFTGQAEPAKPPVLVRDLFKEKVFGDRHLARAVHPRITSRSPPLRRIQWLTVSAFAGMLVALAVGGIVLSRQMDREMAAITDMAALAPSLHVACPDLSQARALFESGSLTEPAAAYWAMPASWFDWREAKARAAFVGKHVLQEALFPALGCALKRRADALADAPPSTLGETGDAVQETPIERVANIERWERDQALFASLSGRTDGYRRADLQTVAALAQGVLGLSMAKTLRPGNDLAFDALQTVAYAPPVVPNLDVQRAQMADALLASSGSYRDRLVADATSGLTACARLQQGTGDPAEDLEHVAHWNRGPGVEWANATTEANPCSSIQHALRGRLADLVDGRDGYPKDKVAATLALFAPDACYRPVARQLEKMSLSWCARALTAPPRAARNLSTSVLGLIGLSAGSGSHGSQPQSDALLALSKAPFLQTAPVATFRCKPPTAWSADEVRGALADVQDYERLIAQLGAPEAASLPGVRAKLFDAVTGHLQRAQASSAAGESPMSASRRFAQEVPDWLELVTLLRQLDADPAHAPWASCARRFATAGLNKATAGWETSFSVVPPPGTPPAPSTASMGRAPAVPHLPFPGLNDVPAAEARFKAERLRVERAVAQARPYAQFLAATAWLDPSDDPDDPLLSTTLDTQASLEADAAGEPSSATLLAGFFRTVLGGLTEANCEERLGSLTPVVGADVFSAAQRRLTDEALTACRRKQQGDAFAKYQRVVSAFEQTLEGRFPFASPEAPDVTLDELSTMAGVLASQEIASFALGEGFEAQDTFLADLRAAVGWLERYGDGRTAIDVGVAFRTRRVPDRPSADILSWTLQSGEAVASFPNGGNRVEWRLNDAVALSLRWANRSALRPSRERRQSDLQVEETLASFRHDGAWALLRLIAEHRDPMSIAPAGTAALHFGVPVSKAPAPDVAARADAYLDLLLRAPDGTPLAIAAFPEQAPALVPNPGDNVR